MCDVEKLLFLIENRAAIYNCKLKDHSDKRVIDKLWLDIAEEMETTVTECKSKYTSLRNSYARFLRDQPPPGSAPNKKKKTWYLASAMEFLRDHMMILKTPASAIELPENSSDEHESKPSIPSPNNDFSVCGESLHYSNASSSSSRKRKLSAADKIEEPMTEYSKTKSNRTDDEDPNLTFFKSLLPDMNKLTDKNQRKVKQDFLLNLNKLLEEQEKKFR